MVTDAGHDNIDESISIVAKGHYSQLVRQLSKEHWVIDPDRSIRVSPSAESAAVEAMDGHQAGMRR